MQNTNTERPYQRCTRCVMDTTDSKITFDEHGVCDHCRNFDTHIKPYWKPKENDFEGLEKLAAQIRKAGKGHEYDCILGLSGGADSSYLAYVAKEVMHLRPLAFVVDTGWNLNVAVENIEKIVKGLNLDMFTEVINWKEMADLQLSAFKASVSSIDVQDVAIFSALYKYAVTHHIKYVLTGSNQATEFIRPPLEWIGINDKRARMDIHKRFGQRELKTFPDVNLLKYKIVYRYVYGMRRVYPLDFVVYDKTQAEELLHEKYGWTKYANKHYENVFTRFFEGYYLPQKFGFDTRKNVLSNEILAGTKTREEALEILSQPPYDPEQAELDKEYIAKKLGVTTDEFEKILARPPKTHEDYKNSLWLLKSGIFVSRILGLENRNLR
ncbi:MAG: N-acetyl sugar amidotransferase [Bacteroidota bacterium]|nr:N-acetyl sugar amidotransferase [Bacteroidota bacterium]